MFSKFVLQQQRAFHCNRNLLNEWTKASLRRMKKTDLIQLAKENHLNISGTKNDIIIQLLSHQTAKIVGSTTPTLHSIRKVIEKSDETPEEAIEADNEWMKAFEIKVAQRGNRKPLGGATKDDLTLGQAKPHPFNDAVKTTVVKPVAEQVKSADAEAAAAAAREETEARQRHATHKLLNEIEGMDPAWVEAFDLKVGSRGARHRLTDTLSPSTPTLSTSVDELPFIKVDTLEKEHPHQSPTAAANTTTTIDNTTDTDKTSQKSDATFNDSKGIWINTAIGTSLLAWYVGGEKGLADIWHFLTSSS